MRKSWELEIGAMVGVDPASDGLARAKRLGIITSHEGLAGLRALPVWRDIGIVFDATSAATHAAHAAACAENGKVITDLTPAAIGPYVVLVVNGDAHLESPNVNMVTCGGQATIPIVAAVSSVANVSYAEVVSSIASRSAGPGTRANIDEFTVTTARGIEQVGGAQRGKAIIILNPAEPPMMMRNTIFTLSSGADEAQVEAAILNMVDKVRAYVPGYRLKQNVQFERFGSNNPVHIPGVGDLTGLKTSVFLEVEGAAHYLPAFAGNLDIMTSAALATAQKIASRKRSKSRAA
jgi:acetaldehyde dehydrogenase